MDNMGFSKDEVKIDLHHTESKIEKKYKIANFHVERKETEFEENRFLKQVGHSWEALFEYRWWSNIILRNVMIVIVYLACHFVIQSLYQNDMLCSYTLWKNTNTGNTTYDPKPCREWAKEWFTNWKDIAKNMLKVITFLVGFFVSTNIRRWWDQIKYMPGPVNIGIQLENLMDNIEHEEALDLKKKIMRYLHASWALVMTQRGGEIRKEFRHDDSYVTKGLLTEEEDQYLKAQIEECDDSIQTLWFAPINWAMILLKKCHRQKKFKDPKDILKDFLKFRYCLGYLLEHKEFKIPIIFSAAVWLAVTGWIGITLIGAQNYDHWTDHPTEPKSSIIFFSIPGHELFIILLILSWLQAADKLSNPFGRDKGYDVNLAEELDVSLWMNSKLLQEQDLSNMDGRIRFLDVK